MKTEHRAAISPYLIDTPPTSPGRALLARAYEHYCVLHWGWSGEQIADAFDGVGDHDVAEAIAWSTRLLGELMATDAIRSFARPFGGGEPKPLKTGVWELDDFRHRFATSAIDPERSFDVDAPASHWIFVDLEDWNHVVEASLMRVDGSRREHSSASVADPGAHVDRPAVDVVVAEPNRACDERLLRRDEVERRTGLSRATIYRRMDAGTFPKQTRLSGNIAVWRESQIADWIANPR